MIVPGARIASDPAPAQRAERQQADQSGERDQHAAVVLQQPPQALSARRRGHHALREREHDGQTFLRLQRARQCPARDARRRRAGLEVAALRALRTAVAFGSHVGGGHRLRQPHLDAAAFDREHPAGADRVPVQLVVIVEEAELARSAVAQGVGVVGGHREEVVVAGVDAHAVVDVLGEPRLVAAVALHAQHLEADHDAVAMAVAIAGREVAVDAAADVVAFRAHRDPFGDVEAAVGADVDLAVVGQDAFLRERRQREEQHGDHRQPSRHRWNSTFGAARCASSA